MGLIDGFLSLGRDVNKTKGGTDETGEGIVSEGLNKLVLDKEDTELVELANEWQERWEKSAARKELERKQAENEKYWLGDHYTSAQKTSGKRELVDNQIFEALETALPFYTKQRADPMVYSDKTPEGEALAKKVTDRIVDIADTLRLRLKVKKAVRHWSLYYLGCIKLGWSAEKNEIAVQVKRPQQLILDPDAITDECEYDGEYLGEYRTDTAENLIARFPEKKDYISGKVKGKLGTKLRYVEWWTPDYLFWKMEGEILGKAKNPHWNYEEQVTGEQTTNEFGEVTAGAIETKQGVNHFSSRKIPYAFLSVFNIGKNPFDDTTLIEQVIPQQDLINKRQRQIDKNADGTNGGAVVSGDVFTKEQAKGVSDALRKGSTVWVPRGNVNSAYKRDTGVPLPNFVYESLVDARNELRGVFGTTGLSSQGIKGEDTVRGKILIRSTDADRNPLVDHLEQFYDYVYNWFVQLMVVYYDDPRAVSRAQGSETISNQDFTHPLIVSVKEGSLIPKDRLTKRNEAIDLWSAKGIDPLTFFERLEDPNPQESANRLILWISNPVAYAQMYAPEAARAGVTQQIQSGEMPTGEQPQEQGSLLGEVPIA